MTGDGGFIEGAPFTVEETRVLRGLEDRGCLVLVFVPSELDGVNPKQIEGPILAYAEATIAARTGY